jgi:hypothetical protein
MTTTRLTQLPTEWVTGDTFDRIMYDTFNQIKKGTEAKVRVGWR